MERNVIIQGDCLEVMRLMPDNRIDLTVTSPPYDNLRKYKGFKFHFKHIARHLYRVTKDGGVVVWVVGDATINGSETGTAFNQALFFKECGFRLHDTMIYEKNNYIQLTHNRYEQCWEYMFVFSKGKPKTFNPIMVKTVGAGITYNNKRKGYCNSITEGANRRRDETITTNDKKIKQNIFNYSCGSISTNHPAPFPEQLAADMINTWSNEGDLVFDPFSGSGTTCKMAHLQNRSWLGCDISQEYVANSIKRIEPHLAVKSLFAA